jgi:hypothetical protein
MRLMTTTRGALRRFWFAGCDPAPAGLFRIGLGLFLVILYVALLPSWERYYGEQGVLATAPAGRDWLDVYAWAGPRVPALLWGWLGLGAALAFTVGFKTRLATMLLFLLELSRSHHGRFLINGEDLVVRMFLFYACFAPLHRSWSIDALRRDVASPDRDREQPSVWPLRLMQVNFLLIYVLSLPNKLMDDEAWLTGDAVYWSIVNDMWGRWPWPSFFFDGGGALSKLATYGTIVVEGLTPWLIWSRRTRRWAIAAIVSMHLGIVVILQNVAFFSVSMIVGFLLFLTPEEARSVVGTLRRWGVTLVRRLGTAPQRAEAAAPVTVRAEA